MKLRLKIILPLLLFAIIIASSFSYLLYRLTLEGRSLAATTTKIQKLNSLVEELNRQQYNIELNVLSYRFNQKKIYLNTITAADLRIAKILDEMSTYITSPKARNLVKIFIDGQTEIGKTRNELINSIKDNNTDAISFYFKQWSLQIGNIRAALADINAFNINSIEGTVVSANELRDIITRTVASLLIIIVVVIFLLYFFFSFFVIWPIRELALITERISHSDFSSAENIKLDTHSEDEIGQLALSFKIMAGKLRESYSGLEKMVKERTSQLEEAKVKDEAMLANIGDGLVFVDLEKRILLVNKAAENMLGWKEEEILGKNWVDIVRPKDDNGVELESDRFLLNQVIGSLITTATTTITDSYNYTKKDNSIFPIAATASRVSLKNESIGAIVVFRDITKDKGIDKAKTEFVSLASHQLRTPLSTINWYTEMLLAGDAGKINDNQKKYLNEIYTGNQRMVKLVNALLNVSRMELGTFSVDPEPTDIIKLAESVLREQSPQITEKKIKLTSNFAKDIPIMQVDPKLLRMVFQNLLSNSVKYTPEQGSITMTIKFIANESENKSQNKNIEITVTDTGYGIPKEQHDKIFTKLFRADNVKEKDTEGTGLGLYLVKSIVEHSEGKIWFESETDMGTTFHITMPLEGMKKKERTKALT